MAEIRQHFAGNLDSASVFGKVGQTFIDETGHHRVLANALMPSGAWCSADQDEFFMSTLLQANQSEAHGNDNIARSAAMVNNVMEGQEMLSRTTALAASCRMA
jgi:hypothetical protein